MRTRSWSVVHGDARQTGLPNAHFHCVATSPPYFGLREYGDDDREIGDEKTPDEYINEMRKVGLEMRRVLRNDGTWWLNLGDSFGPGKSLLMIPQQVVLALQKDGWIIRAQIPWIKTVCSPESVRDRPTVAHEYVFLLVKSQRYFWDADAVRVPASVATIERYGNKTNRNLRTSDFFHVGLDEYERHLAHIRADGGLMLSPDGDPLAFLVNPNRSKTAHFAMWPSRLVAPMIKASTSEKGCCPNCGAQWQRIVKTAVTSEAKKQWNSKTRQVIKSSKPPGQFYESTRVLLDFSPSCECNAGDPIPCRVLDPFAGSGTTMQVCEALGRDSWGVELMAKNLPLIDDRMKTRLDADTMKLI